MKWILATTVIVCLGVIGIAAYLGQRTQPTNFGGIGGGGINAPSFIKSEGKCNVVNYSLTIPATSTQQVDCNASIVGTTTPTSSLASVAKGDTVLVQPSTSTVTTYEGLQVIAASASSTSGTITLQVFNGTGASYAWNFSGTSSLNYIDMR